MTSNIAKMEAGREMRIAIVEKVMKWEQLTHPAIYYEPGNKQHIWVIDEDYTPRTPHKRFLPDTDIAAAYTMEERIAELGKTSLYIKYLLKISNDYKLLMDSSYVMARGLYTDQLYKLVHATPEDRCKAALKATEEK